MTTESAVPADELTGSGLVDQADELRALAKLFDPSETIPDLGEFYAQSYFLGRPSTHQAAFHLRAAANHIDCLADVRLAKEARARKCAADAAIDGALHACLKCGL